MPESVDSRRVNPATLLVATDLNDLDRLMLFAFEQAAASRARLLLLHVLPVGTEAREESEGCYPGHPSSARELALKTLTPWSELARRRGVACEVIVVEGQTHAQISATARHYHADRLLMGTHGATREGRPLLGPVAEQVLRMVNLPVMIVSPEANLPADNTGQESLVLHATALGPFAAATAEIACQIASSHLAKLVLLHVMDAQETRPPMPSKTANVASALGLEVEAEEAPEAHDELRMLAGQLAAEFPVEIEARVAYGNPLIEILAEAAAQRASLILLDAAPRSAYENLTRDRVACQVIAHARCPVLVFRDNLSRTVEVPPEQFAFGR